MKSDDPALCQFIRAKIETSGPVSFAWFMEQALYHPEHGYYSSGRAAIGRRGDYFTNVSVGPIFGKLIAAQFAELWTLLGKPDPFVVVEQGAHGGEFARDVLQSLRSETPQVCEVLRYVIIEPFPIWQDRQRRTLSDFVQQVEWRSDVGELVPVTGIFFANELLDAMPVHL